MEVCRRFAAMNKQRAQLERAPFHSVINIGRLLGRCWWRLGARSVIWVWWRFGARSVIWVWWRFGARSVILVWWRFGARGVVWVW